MPVPAQGSHLAGGFTLVRRLGRGTGGEVWLAAGEAGAVALKFPLDEAAAAAEAAIGARLDHRHIVRVSGHHRDGAHAFIVMQYLDGAASCGCLRTRGFRAVIRSLAGIADALEHCHGRGVVHGDLKPANVLCDAVGNTWLCDFGAAGGGNLPAASPRRLDGLPATPADDVYGFGALLYDLLAGLPLFHPGVNARRIREEVPVIPATDLTGATLPAALRALLSRMLSKSATDRPATMARVTSALAAL